MKLGLGLSVCGVRGSSTSPPEWGGLAPLVDWDMANAVVTSSPSIDSVPDSSGHGVTLTGVASNKPDRITASSNFNGKDSASFTGTKRFSYGNPGVTTNGSISIVAVAKITGSLNTPFANRLVWGAGGVLEMYGAATTGFWTGGCSANFAAKASNDDARNASVVLLTSGTGASGTQRLYVNSTTEEGNGATNGFDLTAGGTIGEPSFNFNGECARIIIFGAILDATQRSNVLNALGTKYGITIT